MCNARTKQVTRYVVVRYTGNGSECVLLDNWAYQRGMAETYMAYRASADFANWAMYGVRKVVIRVRTNEDAKFWNCVQLNDGKWHFVDKAKNNGGARK